MEDREARGGGPGGEEPGGRQRTIAVAPALAGGDSERDGSRFTETFGRTIDDKGRLVLPPAIRTELAGGGFLRPMGEAIALLPPEEMDRLRARLVDKGREGQLSSRNALRALTANAVRVAPDSQGRIPVPAELRARAGIEVEVAVTGMGRWVELWNPIRWSPISDDGEAAIEAEFATFGLDE